MLAFFAPGQTWFGRIKTLHSKFFRFLFYFCDVVFIANNQSVFKSLVIYPVALDEMCSKPMIRTLQTHTVLGFFGHQDTKLFNWVDAVPHLNGSPV